MYVDIMSIKAYGLLPSVKILSVRQNLETEDPYAVKVMTNTGITVEHVPRRISTLCHLFLLKKGSITCQITGNRRYSVDLPQGGLEVPCNLTFVGLDRDIGKVVQLITAAPTESSNITPTSKKDEQDSEEPPSKKSKVENVLPVNVDNVVDTSPSQEVWLKCYGCFMIQSDKVILEGGGQLSDRHINYAQILLQKQFPLVQGLGNTLLQSRKPLQAIKQGLQILHDRGNHWLVASNIGCPENTINLYDSAFSNVSDGTWKVIQNLFQATNSTAIKMVDMQKQTGGNDCGLFAIAVTVTLLHKCNVSNTKFVQDKMRQHLCECFVNGTFTLFPSSE